MKMLKIMWLQLLFMLLRARNIFVSQKIKQISNGLSILEKKILIIEFTVGYMLKVLKSGRPINNYKREFASIRHGNYYDFINLIGEPIPFMVMYSKGTITSQIAASKNDINFAGLLKAGPSLKKFFKDCFNFYGVIYDSDISDEQYRKLVLFEIGLRMHANNNSLLSERDQLEVVIDKLSFFKNSFYRKKKLYTMAENS